MFRKKGKVTYLNPLIGTRRVRRLKKLLKGFKVKAYCRKCEKYVEIQNWIINCDSLVAFHEHTFQCGVNLISIKGRIWPPIGHAPDKVRGESSDERGQARAESGGESTEL